MALFDVISYQGPSDVLIYRCPKKDFNTMSQLIVRESQEAIFFKYGVKMDILPAGRYTLQTNNIPILGKVLNLAMGGETPFQCEVYFVNRAIALSRKWGTSSQARVLDQSSGLYLTIGASGEIGLRVIDPRRLMLEVVGTESELTADRCLNYFRENITMQVKTYIVQMMKQPGISFMDLDGNLPEFSDLVKKSLDQAFQKIGVGINNFVISNMVIPEQQYAVLIENQQRMVQQKYDLLYTRKDLDFQQEAKKISAQGDRESLRIEAEGDAERSLIKARADAQKDVLMAQARAKARAVEGYNWADEQRAAMGKQYAESGFVQQNPATMLAQTPLAFAFGNMLRDNVEPIMNPVFSQDGLNFHRNTAQPAPGSAGSAADADPADFSLFPDVTPADDLETAPLDPPFHSPVLSQLRPAG